MNEKKEIAAVMKSQQTHAHSNRENCLRCQRRWDYMERASQD